MAAFTGKWQTPETVPVQSGFAQSSTSSNQRRIAGAPVNVVEWNKICGRKIVNAGSMRLKIVDQPYSFNAYFFGKLQSADHPGEVWCGDFPVEYGASDAEACAINTHMLIAYEQADNLVQAFVCAAGIDALHQHFRRAAA